MHYKIKEPSIYNYYVYIYILYGYGYVIVKMWRVDN